MNLDKLSEILNQVWEHGYCTCSDNWMTRASMQAPMSPERRSHLQGLMVDWAMRELVPHDDQNAWVMAKVKDWAAKEGQK